MMKLRLCAGALLLLLLGFVSGCSPSLSSQTDEEKEGHYLAGKGRVAALDFKGAIESFQRALEVNPRSALAHFELGILYDGKEPNPAAAIYHYEHYLALRPSVWNAEVVRQRITACKQELAREVSLGPITEKQQRELERLAEENKRLGDEVRRLNDELLKWRTSSTNRPSTQQLAGNSTRTPSSASGSTGASNVTAGSSPLRTGSNVASTKTHTVKPGDTPAAIARQYGVRLESLMAANPGLDPRRMRAGQSLNIPSR